MNATAPPFVGRDSEMTQLLETLRAAAGGKGSTVFVTGEAGFGKQALFEALAARAAADPELAGTLFVTGTCQREHAGQNPYEPFAEILVSLVSTDRSEIAFKAVVEVLKETAPDWLGMIPIVGAGLGAGVKTALRLREAYRSEEKEQREQLGQDRADQFLATLAARLEKESLAVLVISQAQWIDGPSAVLLERVARVATSASIVVLVGYRPDDVGPDHPLHAVEDELVIDEAATRIDLAGLDDAAVAAYVLAKRGKGLTPEAATWLREFTNGNPMFITHLLPVLEDGQILVPQGDVYALDDDAARLARVTLPPSISRAVERRIGQLAQEDRDLLEVAAVEGRRFTSSTLSRVAEVEERQLVRKLGDVEKLQGLIRAQAVIQRHRYAYEFAHLLLQQQMYAGLSEPERVEYHCAVAEALLATFGEEPPRPVLLDIARHWALGRDPAAAAGFLLRAAQSALLDGASPEATAFCLRGLDLAREGADDRSLAELVHLFVTASDGGWVDAGVPIEELLAEGKEAAGRVGDDDLTARLLHAEGNVLLSSKNAAAARRALEEALAAAKKADAAGDPDAVLTQLAIMIDLGNTIDVVSLEDGLAVLREARELYLTRLRPAAGEPDPGLERLFHRLEGFIGVGEFDRGNLGEARRLLDASVDGLEKLGRRYDLPRLLNYRAQTLLASGDFKGAEDDIRRALEVEPEGAWATYNRAFLGKVFLDAQRWDEAGPLLREAFAKAQTDTLSLLILERAYLIEYLLRPGSPATELEEAAALIEDELKEAAAGEFGYCVAWAESLASELALRRGDPAAAVEHGARAVAILDAAGDLPIVRTEEVLHRQSRALAAAGSPDADAMLARARAVVDRKAATLSVEEAARLREGTPTARALG